MPEQTTTQTNPSAAGPMPKKKKDEYYNKGAEDDPDATNREGIPKEAVEGDKEQVEEAEETEHA